MIMEMPQMEYIIILMQPMMDTIKTKQMPAKSSMSVGQSDHKSDVIVNIEAKTYE
jgi:hypothetical protein